MKLMFCERCGDLTVPDSRPRNYRRCRCGEHAVWWEDPDAGILRVHDVQRELTKRERAVDPEDPAQGTYTYDGPPDSWVSQVWIIGLHNQWMMHKLSGRRAIDEVLAITPDTYLFKRDSSIAIKVRPGYSNDTAYDYLPAGWGG